MKIKPIRPGQHYSATQKKGMLPKHLVRNLRRKGWVLHHCWKCGLQFMSKDKGTYLGEKIGYKHICRHCVDRMINQ